MRLITAPRLARRALTILPTVVALGFATSGAAQPVTTPVETTFDLGLEGWAIAPGQLGPLGYAASGGNPGGYARFEVTNPTFTYIEAPASYLGDWSSLDESGILQFDHKIFELGELPTGPPYLPFEVVLDGGANRARFVSTETAQTTWTTVVVPIQEAVWVVEAGTWSGLLASVDNVQIRIELVANPGSTADDKDGIDNVRLLGPVEVPSIAAVGIVVLALALAASAYHAIVSSRRLDQRSA
jgi:hypothetical protein